MSEIFKDINGWMKQGKTIAIATVVKVEGTPFRPLGSKMAVTTNQQIAGSVTGGCIEGAVYEEAQTVIRTGQPKLQHFGVTKNEAPWEIGLSCGSSIDVLIEALDSPAWRDHYTVLDACLNQNQMVATGTVISGSKLGNKLIVLPNGDSHGSLGSKALDEQALEQIKKQLLTLDSYPVLFNESEEQVEVFIDIFAPPARLIIIGAVHTAISLVALAKTLGYHTIVIDPRSAFATRERFPHVDELIIDWPSTALEKLKPDESTYIAVISHDEKLDNPALQVALSSPARYVGVLGTRKNIPRRLTELGELGVTEDQLFRLHAPIGLNVGAIQPEEIALSILSEIVAARHGLLKTNQPQSKSIIPG